MEVIYCDNRPEPSGEPAASDGTSDDAFAAAARTVAELAIERFGSSQATRSP